VLVFTHVSMLEHRAPGRHPERPERLAAVLDALAAYPRREAPWAERVAIERVHPAAFIDALENAFPATGFTALDPDTFVSPGSREAAWRAAGALTAAVDAVVSGETETAFCAVRPPGHHAEPRRAMGFCLFNNIAIGALHALDAHGLSRVAVIDFDVHHGNGTQAAAFAEPRLFFASTHQTPLYPGTGAPEERGCADNVLNAPMPEGADGRLWRGVMSRTVLPAVEAFAPALLLVSVGFDAHGDDPLAGCALTTEDYAWAGRELRALQTRCGARGVVSALEGGYDLAALAQSAAAFVQALAGR
jgi:acetoin utilization deacetylase AcuC-like enzyme